MREEVYISQPDGFVDKNNLNHVYKLKKALYGLKQAPRTCYDLLLKFLLSQGFSKGIFLNQSKYALESLKKYGMESSNPMDTLIVEKSKLDEDPQGKAIDPIHNRGMVGTLMYLTASRPDLTFVFCICARYQEKPIERHLHALMYTLIMRVAKILDEVHLELADIFTKALCRERIEFLINKLGMRSFTPETLKQLADEAKEMNDKGHTLNLENFKDMLQICPRLPCHKFEDPSFEEEILSFIRDLGHTGEIKGMYHKKNVDYVYLLWEDLDQSISRRNKMFWHTARDDPMFNTITIIFRHQDIHIYGAILPDVLTNQEMLDTKAYKEYYVVASEADAPKAKTKYKKKADEHVTSSKTKTVPASKGSKLKSSAKLATKRSKKDFYMSHTSGSSDGVDIQSKVPDELHEKVTSTNKAAGVRLEVPDFPKYASKSDEESCTFRQDKDDADEEIDVNDDTYDEEEEEEKADDDEVSSNHRVYTPPDYQLTDEEENQEGDDEFKEGEKEQ
nr:hypothetical protein [Tanacetum cinerariifolium]